MRGRLTRSESLHAWDVDEICFDVWKMVFHSDSWHQRDMAYNVPMRASSFLRSSVLNVEIGNEMKAFTRSWILLRVCWNAARQSNTYELQSQMRISFAVYR